jgi:hypothetical protein
MQKEKKKEKEMGQKKTKGARKGHGHDHRKPPSPSIIRKVETKKKKEEATIENAFPIMIPGPWHPFVPQHPGQAPSEITNNKMLR